jgi:hypothetical protein
MLEFQDGTRMNSQVRTQDEVNLHNQERGQLMQVEWKQCSGLSRDNFASFTRPVTFGKRHHSLPYNIFCAYLQGLHPNVTFPWEFQVGVPKLRLFLSQNFGHSCLSQIKFFLRNWRQNIIALKKIFPKLYNMLQPNLICPLLSKGLWLGVKCLIWLLPLLLIITHAN